MLKKTTFFLTMTVLAEIYGRKLSDITLGYLYEGLPDGLTDDVWNYAVRKYIDSGERFFPSPGQLLDGITDEGVASVYKNGVAISGSHKDPKCRVLSHQICVMFNLESNILNPATDGVDGQIKEHGIWRSKTRSDLNEAEKAELDERVFQIRSGGFVLGQAN